MLVAAAGVRAAGLFSGIPFAAGIDEPVIVERALGILRTGDWNPHAFDYPSLTIYLHTFVAGARFLWGAVAGEWSSLAAADPAAFYGWARVAAASIGVATVWVTYRLGCRLGSTWLGLAAAAQLAVMPLHVRESHFALTDVPATFLVLVTLLLTVRATQERTPGAYAWAGCAAGLAAAAKYNAGVVLLPVLLAWVIDAWDARWAGRRAATVALIPASASAAFIAGAPYTVLDLPAFLNGFAAQLARFAPDARTLAEPAGILYLKHLHAAAHLWLPAAAAGVILVLVRAGDRRAWAPLVGFLVAYAWVLATHPLVFARYALPVVPAICLFAAVPIVRLGAFVAGRAASRHAAPVAAAVLALTLLVPFTISSVDWIRQMRRPDTRTVTAEMMRATLPPGSIVAVESYGPTNLERAGFIVVITERLIDHDLDWYAAAKVEYLVVSGRDLNQYRALLRTAPVVQVSPADGQWGPPILVFPTGLE